MAGKDGFEEKIASFQSLWLKQYDKGVKRFLPVPQDTFKDLIKQWRARHPDKCHIICGDIILTYRESDDLACRLGNALLSFGCRKGDRFSIMLPNIPEIMIAFMACYKTGVVAVPLNPRSTEPEIEKNLNNNGAETIITSNEFAYKAVSILHNGNTALRNVLVVDYGSENEQENVHDFTTLIRRSSGTEPDIQVFPDDLQMLSYTGGTTGVSKGCCHTGKAIVGHGRAFMNWLGPALEGVDTRIFMCLPMTHNYGINCGIHWNLAAGGTTIIMDSFTPDSILDIVNKFEPTIWPAVPALINQLVFHPRVKESKIATLKLAICGSAPLATETFAQFKKLTKAKVVEGYGMSESVNAVTFNPTMGGGKAGSIGVPISDTDVLIVDTEEGNTAMPFNQRGEIIYRGPQTIQEYWQNPEENAHAIRNGWLYSGDIGYMDEDGYLYIVDRKKDMIIVGGFNVFPREIDELLFQHPKIFESCTIGVPEPRLGEVVKSFVVLQPGEMMTAEEVIVYCRENLTAYKIPKFVEFLSEIPKTKVNKPDKEALRKREREKLECEKGIRPRF